MALPKFDEWRREKGLLPTEGIAWDIKGEKKQITEKQACDLLIKLNSATTDKLCEVKGIGSKTAEKIIENGPYENIDEVINKTKLKMPVYKALKEWLEA